MSLLWDKLAKPLMFRLDAETAHDVGMRSLRAGLASPFYADNRSEKLQTNLFWLSFANPIGLAAGFDKNALVTSQMASLGFGFVEVGTVTHHPQPGNPQPRMFRLPKDNALINRLGFNNHGAAAIVERLRDLDRKCVIGVNIGKNKDVPNEEAVENYLATFELVHSYADYIALNISSPNTPNLRELQRAENLDDLLGSLQSRNKELGAKPLLVKIAPDLTDREIEAAVDISLKHSMSGIIATNTTISRDGLVSDINDIGAGGLSGSPLRSRSTDVISTIHRYSAGKLPIIGVGGIFTANDAFEKIAAGASLIQAYTGFIYGGPRFAQEIVRGLEHILEEKGFSSLSEAVGVGDRAA